MGHAHHRPPTKVHRFRSSSRVVPPRYLRHHAHRGCSRVVESPKFYVIDSNWPQHHAVSVQHNRAGEHWGSTITELVAASLSHRLAIGVLRVTVAATSERE